MVGLLAALVSLAWRLPRILVVHLGSKRLRPKWREALWLAVTEVKGCRFCSYVHEGMAGAAGLSPDDIQLLLASGDPNSLAALEPRESLAVAYAKAWADTDRKPGAGLLSQLGAELSDREVNDLHALLHAVNFANRAGNTADSLLGRLRHPRRLLEIWPTLNDLVVGTLVALFGWPAMVMGAILRWRNRKT
jgi:AhpD family alkylhydroperoxidase